MGATTTMMRTTGALLALGLALGVEGGAGQSALVASAPRSAGEAPVPWLQEDPGTKAYQAAREALNARRYEEAARLFEELRRSYPRSAYVAEAYYYEAFARSRGSGRTQLQRALELLGEQREAYPRATTLRAAEALRVRIEAQLARRGDAQAAEAIARQAATPCGPEDQVRAAALSALLNMNADQAMPILREVLKSRDACSSELRKQALFLISQKMTPESVEILLDLAHRNPDPDPEVREQAVFWLSQVKSEEALAALEFILQETDDPQIQERAVFALSQHGSARAAEVLMKLAERPGASKEIREQAIFWIGQNPQAGGVRYLLDLYPRLDDPELRERAVFAISQTNSEESRRWLLERLRDASESLEVRKMALFWAGQTGTVPASDLAETYRTLDDPEMKEQVVFVASQMKGSEAVDFLMEVARSETNPELRERAIFWLGQSKDPRGAEFLLSLIRG
ncbi:MAG: hypothetical protein FIA95_11795 [Gemmatimonadetes bacterium]|nr:hypothetical protein [Gemmatimonadota bacterium]